MFRLFLHENAESDLEDLWDQAPRAAARLTVLLEELEGNQDLLDRLSQHDFGVARAADFHVSKWVEQWRRKKTSGLKVWDLENKGMRYRMVYAFVPVL